MKFLISAELLISLLAVTQYASNILFITILKFYVYTSIYIYELLIEREFSARKKIFVNLLI